jgi:glycosyltransferase involved in cell wall biosynthesis
LIQSYNTGGKLLETVVEASQHWPVVWIVVDGSTDGSGDGLVDQWRRNGRLCVLRRAADGGKGAAVLDGLHAAAAGFTHALVMDADGQHPAAMIPAFMALSRDNPEAMILSIPVFDRQAPRVRVLGRRVSTYLAKLETAGAIGDSLFGFRVYPIAALMAAKHRPLSIKASTHWRPAWQ